MAKLRDRRGETLTETLCAVLVLALAVALLAAMISASSRLDRKTDQTAGELYQSANQAEQHAEPTKSGTVSVQIGEEPAKTVEVDFYGDSDQVVSYQEKPGGEHAMIAKKFRSRRGMTLAETLTALAIFAILSAALVVGTTAAWKVYQKAVVAGEARTLQSTIAQALTDELRYARNIQVAADNTVTFDSDTFGVQVSVKTTDTGRLQIGAGEKFYDLLPERAYTKGLKAEVSVSYDNGFFEVTLTVKHRLLPAEGRKITFTVRALNSGVS